MGDVPRLLVAGVSTRAMAESAARAGYAVTALDAFGDLDQHPGVRALSLPRDFGVAFSADAVVRAAKEIEADAVAYLSPFENHASAIGELARGRALWGNGPSVVEAVRDPAALGRLVSDALGDERWLIKPRASGGGHGIRWWTPGEAVPAGWHVQRFVEGVPGSIIFVAARGHATPLGLTRQLVGDAAFGASGFRYCGNVLLSHAERSAEGAQARNRDHPERRFYEAATQLAHNAASEVDLVGVNCIDFIARSDGTVVPIETNPRWSASMELVERAYDVSVFGMHAAACTAGVLPTLESNSPRAADICCGKAVVFARHDIVCGDTQPWLDDATVRDVPHPGEHIAAGRPVCTVFANGSSYDACYAALLARARLVYSELESWSSVAA